MKSKNLDSLVKIGQIKKEPFDEKEYNGVVNSGKARLKDAQITSLSPESRFDLAYNAAHALALAALRKCGYREFIFKFSHQNRIFKKSILSVFSLS